MHVRNASAFTRARACGLGAAMLIATAPAAVAQQFVDWTHPVNVAIRGDTVEKVRGCDGCDDAGAVSRQAIRSGDGYAEFTVGDADSFWVAGLSHRATTRLNDIDFAFRFNGGGWADVMENGVYQPGGDTPYGAGDVFRIAVRNGTVQYIRNGRVLRESATAPQYPLVFDAALGTIGASIRHARIDTGDNRAFSRYDAQEQYDRFDALDLNGDGVITLNEWRGPRRVFDELDADHNGRLTLHEFYNEDVVAQDVPEYAGTSGQTIRVDPRVRWTDTGIWIEQGDTVSFEADGTIQMSDNPDDKAGPAGSWTNRRALDAPLRQASAGSLIARIGNSPARLVGDRRTIDRAPVSGRLYLGVNDDYLEDNTGEYRVRITIERR